MLHVIGTQYWNFQQGWGGQRDSKKNPSQRGYGYFFELFAIHVKVEIFRILA